MPILNCKKCAALDVVYGPSRGDAERYWCRVKYGRLVKEQGKPRGMEFFNAMEHCEITPGECELGITEEECEEEESCR